MFYQILGCFKISNRGTKNAFKLRWMIFFTVFCQISRFCKHCTAFTALASAFFQLFVKLGSFHWIFKLTVSLKYEFEPLFRTWTWVLIRMIFQCKFHISLSDFKIRGILIYKHNFIIVIAHFATRIFKVRLNLVPGMKKRKEIRLLMHI